MVVRTQVGVIVVIVVLVGGASAFTLLGEDPSNGPQTDSTVAEATTETPTDGTTPTEATTATSTVTPTETTPSPTETSAESESEPTASETDAPKPEPTETATVVDDDQSRTTGGDESDGSSWIPVDDEPPSVDVNVAGNVTIE